MPTRVPNHARWHPELGPMPDTWLFVWRDRIYSRPYAKRTHVRVEAGTLLRVLEELAQRRGVDLYSDGDDPRVKFSRRGVSRTP